MLNIGLKPSLPRHTRLESELKKDDLVGVVQIAYKGT